jgi:hypothetical protein
VRVVAQFHRKTVSPSLFFCPDNCREENVKIGKAEINIDGKRVPATSDEKDQLLLLTIFANIH